MLKPIELDDALREKLEQLPEGQELELEVDGETVKFMKPVPTKLACKKHKFVPQGGEGDHLFAVCSECGNGRVYSPKKWQLEDGALVRL